MLSTISTGEAASSTASSAEMALLKALNVREAEAVVENVNLSGTKKHSGIFRPHIHF